MSLPDSMSVVVQVAGPYACFTRPELKAERVSYPVITPTAARGVLEAVFWKPEMRYVVQRIEVLRPVRWFRVRRNETNAVPSLRSALGGAVINTEASRDQRSTLGLRDVAYRIHARVVTTPDCTRPARAYREQFQRRVARGACFSQPYLGCREMVADFGEPDDMPAIAYDADLGLMPFTGPPQRWSWFHARVEGGVLDIPDAALPGVSVVA